MWGRMDDNQLTTTMPNKKCSKNNKSPYISFFTLPTSPQKRRHIQLLYQGNDDEEHKTDPRWAWASRWVNGPNRDKRNITLRFKKHEHHGLPRCEQQKVAPTMITKWRLNQHSGFSMFSTFWKKDPSRWQRELSFLWRLFWSLNLAMFVTQSSSRCCSL